MRFPAASVSGEETSLSSSWISAYQGINAGKDQRYPSLATRRWSWAYQRTPKGSRLNDSVNNPPDSLAISDAICRPRPKRCSFLRKYPTTKEPSAEILSESSMEGSDNGSASSLAERKPGDDLVDCLSDRVRYIGPPHTHGDWRAGCGVDLSLVLQFRVQSRAQNKDDDG